MGVDGILDNEGLDVMESPGGVVVAAAVFPLDAGVDGSGPGFWLLSLVDVSDCS